MHHAICFSSKMSRDGLGIAHSLLWAKLHPPLYPQCLKDKLQIISTTTILKQPKKPYRQCSFKKAIQIGVGIIHFYTAISTRQTLADCSCEEKGKKKKKGIWELNAPPGFKQQQQPCSVSPQAPFFSSSASQRVRGAESAQHRWKCHHVVYAILGFFILLCGEEGVHSATWIPSLSHLFPLGGGKKRCFVNAYNHVVPRNIVFYRPAYLWLECSLKALLANNSENDHFRASWLMICTRLCLKWNCLLCFVWLRKVH